MRFRNAIVITQFVKKVKNGFHLYEREFIIRYFEHCIVKVENMAKVKTNDEMLIEKSDIYKNMTRLERYVNAIRHTQHHAAQLGLRLQFLSNNEMEWISRGYES